MKQILTEKRFRYLSLTKEIALTDFKLKYQGSALGYFWSLGKPLAEFTVLYLVFTKIFKLGSTIPHYPIYLLLGILIFSFWGEATSIAMQSIAGRGDLMRKVYFPRVILIISSTVTAFITFLLNALVIIVFALFNQLPLHLGMLWSVFYFFELYLFILGVSFYLSAFFVKYRDIAYIWDVINRILFYGTPILYAISSVPDKFARIMVISPLAQIILDVRHIIIGSAIPTVTNYWSFPLSFLPHFIVLFILASGYFIFNKMAAKFAEEV
jgi:ABC-2 type transport system permease protein